MTSSPVVLAEGLGHPQGPDVLADGSVVFAETYTGRIAAHRPGEGITILAAVGGGPNAVLAAPDGSLYFTQNGGQAGAWRSPEQRPPAVVRLLPGSYEPEVIATAADGAEFLAPHDLALGSDGTLYVTDSGTWDADARPDSGRLIAVGPDGAVRTLLDTGHTFPSGIAVADDGAVLWAECYTNRVMRLPPGGRPEVLCTLPEEQLPECLKIGPDGTLWIAGLFAEGVVVLDRHGRQTDFVPTGGLPLNCVLADGALYVTDLGSFDESEPEAAQMTGRLLKVLL
ncbi:SMP-30/gluconolactonase/LRE family protein [Streptomyces sp. NPDC091280]|uniref:SMP-30/gluconolactonase/LRE family protein n=1 Tax=Streptomyces sp. NPDC091280 TaxID=3365984 RepID=UPI0037F2560D